MAEGLPVMEDLLILLVATRGQEASGGGADKAPAVATDVAAARERASQAFSRGELASLRPAWETALSTAQPADSSAPTQTPAERLLQLMADTRAQTQIVLYPEYLGYFAQEASLNELPRVGLALGELRDMGQAALSSGTLARRDRAQLDATARRVAAAVDASLRTLRLAARFGGAEAAEVARAADALESAWGSGLRELQGRVIEVDIPQLDAAGWTAAVDGLADAASRTQRTVHQVLRDDLNSALTSQRMEVAAVLCVLATLILAATALAVLVVRHANASLRLATRMADSVAGGDLTEPALTLSSSARDEGVRLVAELLRMAGALRSVVHDVRDGATGVATASQEIAGGNADLSARTERQATALQEAAMSMQAISGLIAQGGVQVQEAGALAARASSTAQRGAEGVLNLVSTVQSVTESTREIAEIVGTIDSIAFQTNILALNAAVEAARAGEQGRGFAVVASEVRNLAQRCAASARDVRRLISTASGQVKAASQQGSAAKEQVSDIVNIIAQVHVLMASISQAADEQGQSVHRVSQMVGEMDTMTQHNAALVEQSAAASSSLMAQSRQQESAVAVFRF